MICNLIEVQNHDAEKRSIAVSSANISVAETLLFFTIPVLVNNFDKLRCGSAKAKSSVPQNWLLFTYVFVCRPDEESGFLEGQPYECVAQFEQTAPGDFLFFYRDEESEEEAGGEEERLKGEISAAYEKVASTAHMEGSLRYVTHRGSPSDHCCGSDHM